MSDLDQFAVHAPPVPDWFEPEMPEPRPESRYSETERDFDRSPKLVNAAEVYAWDLEFVRQKLIQWPYAWAGMQLKEHERRKARSP